MRDAYLVGAAQSDFGSFPDESYRSLFEQAYTATLSSVPHGIDPDDIDEAVIGTLGVGGRQIGLPGPAVTEHVGLSGIPCTRVENACAASGYAVRQAVQAVKSGMADVVLAGGVEVMTDLSGDATRWWLGVSGETEWERLSGTTFAGVYAQMASSHMKKYGTTTEHLSHVAVKNHRNGAKNPHAQLRFECSLEDAMNAPTVADPLTLYHCCPTTDGAACALIVSEDVVEEYTDDPIRVAGVGAGSDKVGLFQRDTYSGVPASQRAAEQAYEMAGVGPDDIDFAEVHDCFSIAELMAYEDLGFCEPGEAGPYVASGATDYGGDVVVNASGGLKSKGHPIGATGAGQVAEAFTQLSGRAGERQVEDARYGLTHNVGGSGGAAVVHIFETEEQP
ncbi:thiolase domain-containing protein [Haladaptatus sp. ZSTT2]|uniref:thiolase domain-containing protein n=1 Tax=Haladaptatus sp. ZSTT2 TaxID=3120515 RepID=UPI00300ED7DE